MSFWDIIWFIVISFAFIAYLMVLFSILGDLFRDKETSGLAKAVWVIALIVFPFLSAFIYIVTRGRSMAERSVQEAVVNKQQTDAYIRDVAGSTSPTEQIEKAQHLLDAGTITRPEDERFKQKALAGAPAIPGPPRATRDPPQPPAAGAHSSPQADSPG